MKGKITAPFFTYPKKRGKESIQFFVWDNGETGLRFKVGTYSGSKTTANIHFGKDDLKLLKDGINLFYSLHKDKLDKQDKPQPNNTNAAYNDYVIAYLTSKKEVKTTELYDNLISAFKIDKQQAHQILTALVKQNILIVRNADNLQFLSLKDNALNNTTKAGVFP